jgi:tyrosyl-DNA phosphodiesterase 1
MEQSRKHPRTPSPEPDENAAKRRTTSRPPKLIPSPFHLTRIRDLPDGFNRDTITLRDLLGDPLITECWNFNFMHDIGFIMNAFDEDTRSLVKLHIVHGYWKREDASRIMLEAEAKGHPNITLHTAFMPEPFGTHHSKMIILFRNDETAQVIIHTANTIAKDWTNMTNGVWKSPILPLQMDEEDDATQSDDSDWESRVKSRLKTKPEECTFRPFGAIGEQFKTDLLGYVRAYDSRKPTCGPLADRLSRFDFSGVKARLIASVPGRHPASDSNAAAWGWVALRKALKCIEVHDGDSLIVAQMSSIATLGPKPTWLHDTLFNALGSSRSTKPRKPRFKVVFPTADEIRRSLDGYDSGASIHTKIQSAQQTKQLEYMKPIFCHWANDCPGGVDVKVSDGKMENSGRNRAAPHIKTYIRFGKDSIDWALLTSANLSKQAWGEAVNAEGKIRIASWEIGVLVWPRLFGEEAVMVETFQTDTPDISEGEGEGVGGGRIRVGLRLPYSLPLQSYGNQEKPWVATLSHSEADCLGRHWII